MKAQMHGSIVNIGSIAAYTANPDAITYSATKAAVVGNYALLFAKEMFIIA